MGEPASVLIIIGSGAVILVAVGAIAFRDGIIVRPSTRAGAVLLVAFGVLLLAVGVLLAFHTSAGPPVASAPTSSSAPISAPAATPSAIAMPGATPASSDAPAPPAAIATTTRANPAPPTAPAQQPHLLRPCTKQQTTPVRDGGVEGMAGPEGYDLDCGVRDAPEDVPGLDISGRRVQPVIDSLATSVGGELAQLPDSGPHDRSACDALPRSAWATNVPGIDRPGAAMCVRTNEGNIAVITITTGWTAEQPELSFTYRIWYV